MGGSDFITLRLCGVAAGAILALSSCTFLFNPDDLGGGSGGDGGVPPADAERPDGIPLDPGQFGISGVEPGMVQEGEGTAWAVPIVVSGQEFDGVTLVVLNGAGFAARAVPAAVAADGTSLAFPLSVPVLTDVGRGETAMITVTVTKGALSDTIPIVVNGLDELVTSELSDTTLQASDLDPLYSSILIDDPITLTGTQPVRLMATAEIRLEAAVIADGASANGEIPGQGGPGGCAGGPLQGDGGCGDGGGSGNPRDDGAGGGGHFTMGTPGGGQPPAAGGVETGRRELVPLSDEAGNGGGGSSQGGGGGGGGTVELTSFGTFTVAGNGSISANGGNGGDGRCDTSAVAGSGGGGSGGTILLRSWGGFDDQVNAPRLSVRGGAGGDMPPDNDCIERGGAGSSGRVRVDTSEPGGPPLFAQSTPEPFQGPLLRNIGSSGPVPVITSEPQITLQAFGDRDTGFTLEVNGIAQALTTAADGTASATAPLRSGSNKVCAKIDANTPADLSEGVQCIDIVSIQ
jgi:hypothetical protein